MISSLEFATLNKFSQICLTSGSPIVWINSAGSLVMMSFGCLPGPFLSAVFDLTFSSVAFSASCFICIGGVSIGFQLSVGSAEVYHQFPPLRQYCLSLLLLIIKCGVFTTYWYNSDPLMFAKTGSPSINTNTVGSFEQNIFGGLFLSSSPYALFISNVFSPS